MTIKAFVFDAYGTLYDVGSISRAVDAAFPGHGEYITQVWRLKQLEYSWLRSLMGRYEDFLTVSRESLNYTLGTLGLTADDALLAVGIAGDLGLGRGVRVALHPLFGEDRAEHAQLFIGSHLGLGSEKVEHRIEVTDGLVEHDTTGYHHVAYGGLVRRAHE